MKKLFAFLLVLMMLATAVVSFADETIKIGAFGPLTGDVAQYGVAVNEGVVLYIDSLNQNGGLLGKQVELIWEDDKGDITEAINAYNKLVYQDEVVALIGGVTTKPTIAAADYAKDEGIPMITASATAYEVTEGKPNVFRACFLDPFQAKTMANYAKEVLGFTKLAVIYDVGDDYSIGLAETFKAQAAENGQEIVAYEAGAAADVDFKAQLTNIKNAGPEAIFVAFYYKEASNIMRQSLEVGLNDVLFLSADGMNGIENMITDNDELLSRLFYTDHYASDAGTPEVEKFNADFEAKYGKQPYSAFNATGYDAALVLIEAIQKAGTTDYDAVVEAMKNTDTIGVTGNLKFDDHNDPIKSAFIMTIKEGKEVFVHQQNP